MLCYVRRKTSFNTFQVHDFSEGWCIESNHRRESDHAPLHALTMSAANFDLEAAKYFLELAFAFLHLKK